MRLYTETSRFNRHLPVKLRSYHYIYWHSINYDIVYIDINIIKNNLFIHKQKKGNSMKAIIRSLVLSLLIITAVFAGGFDINSKGEQTF